MRKALSAVMSLLLLLAEEDLALADPSGASVVNLAWDQSPDTNVVGYTVYSGNSSGAYNSRLDVGTNTAATVTALRGLTYFFVVTSHDAKDLESEPSNEVSYNVPAAADLAITITANPPVLNVGSNVTYTIAVTNAGPDSASSVTVTHTCPPGEIFVGATTSQGTTAHTNGLLTFSLGPIPGGAQVALTVVATAISPGTLINTASVSTTTSEFTLSNNFASASVSITTNLSTTVPIHFSVNELKTLKFTNSVADLNLRPGSLFFTMNNAPSGAAVDLLTGVFMWTPNETQGPSTNIIYVVVVGYALLDALPLICSKTIAVVVNEVNSAPVLPLQTNRIIAGPTTLLVTNSANDPDIPVNILTYKLINAPAGATIDSNGIITWTPLRGQVPSANVITTVVTDYNPWAVNLQSLSATNSFTVIVLGTNGAPAFRSITRTGATLLLTWSTTIGESYQVQYQTAITQTNWNNLGSAFNATNTSATVSDIIAPDQQRFYRVVLLP